MFVLLFFFKPLGQIECGKKGEHKTELWNIGIFTGWRNEDEAAKEME